MPFAKPRAATLIGVAVSFALAMVLRILPLPPGWFALNPDWIALLIIYWTLVAPDRVGVLIAWVVGLSADALTGRLLGQHALAYAVLAYLNLRVREHLLVFPVPLQCLWILFILLLGQWLVLWTERAELAESMRLTYWLPALTGALAWPLVLWVMPSVNRPADEP
jgi:rod shape-determining protein MreD